jgi:hypothetical protein
VPAAKGNGATMRIEIEENPAQLLDIQNAVRMMLKNARLRWILYALGIFFATLFCIYGWYVTGDNYWVGVSFFPLFVLALFCYRVFIFLPHIFPRRYHKNIVALGQLTTVIDDNGILEKAENLQAFHNWDAVVKHMEGQDGIAIFFVNGNFKYIPKRLLGAEEEKELKEKLALSCRLKE